MQREYEHARTRDKESEHARERARERAREEERERERESSEARERADKERKSARARASQQERESESKRESERARERERERERESVRASERASERDEYIRQQTRHSQSATTAMPLTVAPPQCSHPASDYNKRTRVTVREHILYVSSCPYHKEPIKDYLSTPRPGREHHRGHPCVHLLLDFV